MQGPGLPLVDAALRLGMTYHQVRNLLLSGALRGGRDGYGRLYVDPEDVERFARERGSRPNTVKTR